MLTFKLPSHPSQLSDCPVLLSLPLPADTTLGGLVCTYGFYGLPPNVWLPCNADIASITLLPDTDSDCPPPLSAQFGPIGCVAHGCFLRALRCDDADSSCIWVAITQECPAERPDRQQLMLRALQPPLSALRAEQGDAALSPSVISFQLTALQLERLSAQVVRMFQLDPLGSDDAEFDSFYSLVPGAREQGFARMFRSPSLFEDCVKTVTLCNTNWPRITVMNELLSTQVGAGRGYRLRVVATVPPPALCLANLSQLNGVTESAQSRRLRGGVTTLLKEDGRLIGVRHELTVGVFPSPGELASATDELLRAKSAAHRAAAASH